jgi:hypothetical protein
MGLSLRRLPWLPWLWLPGLPWLWRLRWLRLLLRVMGHLPLVLMPRYFRHH